LHTSESFYSIRTIGKIDVKRKGAGGVFADALFRLVHTGSFGVATQALLLLHQLMTSRNSVSDRFYRALYSALLSPELPRSTKGPMFLSLLFKAVTADVSPKRVAAFAKRLLQVALEAPANFACGCLVLVSGLLKSRPGLWTAVLQPEDLDADDGVERFNDGEKEKNGGEKKIAAAAIQLNGLGTETSDEDDAEAAAAAPAVNGDVLDALAWPGQDCYDMRKRDPQYCHADRSCLWELLPLGSHAHPSVAAMARTLLAGALVTYDGDPLRDLTLGTFLDKFVRKNPKSEKAKGDSAMQPLRSGAGLGVGGGTAVGTAAALADEEGRDVAPDDAFFHKFYSVQAMRQLSGGAAAAKQRKSAKAQAAAAHAAGDEDLISDMEDSEDDSGAADDFLVAEEEGGDEGIGADPDRGAAYDYSQLAAAMSESEPEDDPGSGDEEVEVEEEEGLSESGAGSLDSLDSLDSGTSDSEDDDAAADAEIAELLKKRKNRSFAFECDGKEASAKKRMSIRGSSDASLSEEEEEDIGDDVNPFDLAEPSSDSQEVSADWVSPSADAAESPDESDSDSDDSDLILDDDDLEDAMEDEGSDRNGRSSGAVFASAEDYDDVIQRDLRGEVDASEADRVKAGVLNGERKGRKGRRTRGEKRQGKEVVG